MNVILGVTSCDKCGETMKKDQEIIIISEGKIAEVNDILDCAVFDVRYACHKKCWDGFEEPTF